MNAQNLKFKRWLAIPLRAKGSLISILLIELLLSGCSESSPSTLAPKGPGAEMIADLWWLMLSLATAVFVIVMGLLTYALFRRRDETKIEINPTRERSFVIIGGIIMPTIILLVVYGFALRTMSALAASDVSDEYVIEIVGHQWWWEINYPNQEFTTANEIHIPVGQPVELRVATVDVIHSVWVPELNGKIDMIPNQVNEFWLEADESGVYYGICAEFCGIQHAKMLFVVVAESPEEFSTWMEAQQQPAPAPADPLTQQGQQLFMDKSCGECHRIEGTEAQGTLGPDLTHFASRLTIGAGILPNNRGHLAGWIANAQDIKPGNLMPASNITGPELQALLAYLETLE